MRHDTHGGRWPGPPAHAPRRRASDDPGPTGAWVLTPAELHAQARLLLDDVHDLERAMAARDDGVRRAADASEHLDLLHRHVLRTARRHRAVEHLPAIRATREAVAEAHGIVGRLIAALG